MGSSITSISYVIVAAGGSIVIVVGSGQFAQAVSVVVVSVSSIGSLSGSRHYFYLWKM